MARIKLNEKVRASSLVEVLISMIVIMAVFAIAVGILMNVQRLSLSGKKMRAQAILSEQLLNAEHSISISKRTITVDGINIDQDISAYHNSPNLYEIDLKAYDENKELIAEIRKVVYEAR